MNWTDIPVDITGLLHAAASGDPDAKDDLYREVYTALLSIARQKVHALGSSGLWTAGGLLQEAFLRLETRAFPALKSRRELRVVMTRIMMSLLIDQYRHLEVVKRSEAGQTQPTPIEPPTAEHVDVLRGLSRLRSLDHRQFDILVLKECAELTHEEIATELGFSVSTIRREHSAGRAWLRAYLDGTQPASARTRGSRVPQSIT